jgi:hypothetical protein
MKKYLENKDRLVVYAMPYQENSFFHSLWFQKIANDNFIIERYDDNKTYSDDVVFVVGARQYLVQDQREKFANRRVIVDATWESYTGKYKKVYSQLRNPNHLYMYGNYNPEPVEGAVFVPNFLWYNESLWWKMHRYDQYTPNRNYSKKFLMPIGHDRGWRVDTINALKPWLDSDALWSCISHGVSLPVAENKENIVWHRYQNFSWYDDTCFTIALESARSWDEAIIFLTEKIYKPIGMKHPFMVMGQAGMLQYLKSQGFMSYDNLFDESYDLTSDLTEKIAILVKNVSNYEKVPYDAETLKRIDHNFNLFYNEERVLSGLQTDYVDPMREFINKK